MSSSSIHSSIKKRKRPYCISDALYFLCLFGVGAASAGLPFYVHFHPGEFGPPTMQFSGNPERNLAESIGNEEYKRRFSALLTPLLQFDQITTGSIPSIKGARAGASILPFPAGGDSDKLELTLLYVGPNRALVDDNGEITLVSVGEKLSNGISVLSITKRGEIWEVKTSDGGAYDWSPRQE